MNRRRQVVRSSAQTLLLAAALAIGLAPPPASALPTAFNQPIKADFREVAFEDAITFLSENAGVNIVLSPKAKELSKPVTVHLVDLPFQRVLDYLVRGQGLVYRTDGSAIFVATLDEMEAEPMETRVFTLKQGAALFADFEPITETSEGVALEAASIRKLKSIKDVLSELVPQVTGSSLLLDERTGSLIVTHVPYYLDQIAQLLTELDVSPIELRIEARFIEVTLTNTDEFGLDAGLNSDAPLTKKDARDGSTQGNETQLSSLGTILKRGTAINYSDFSRQTSKEGLDLTLQGILTNPQYQAVLHALAENKRTKTLSAPQVTTLNNQTAAIKVVTQFVYASRYEASVKKEDLNGDGDFTDVVNGVRETRFVNVPQDFVTKDLGILLNVTPSVGSDLKTITLSLKPEVSEKKTEDTFAGEIKLPRFTTRSLATTVVVEDGETVVLGGLMKDTATDTLTGVPFFNKIPVIGKLFTKHSKSVERSNLLMFITAHINRSNSKLAQSPGAP